MNDLAPATFDYLILRINQWFYTRYNEFPQECDLNSKKESKYVSKLYWNIFTLSCHMKCDSLKTAFSTIIVFFHNFSSNNKEI